MVRLFVGGLAHDTTSDQLALRFQSFGKVTGCDVIGPKEEGVFRRPDTTCRGFGYLNLEPANDSALRKCLAVYNGSKWRGGVLRVQPAKQHFLEKLRHEEAEEKAEEEENRKKRLLEDEQAQEQERRPASRSEAPLILIRPDGKEIQVRANKRKVIFPEHNSERSKEAIWESVSQPPGLLRREAFVKSMEASFNAAAAREAWRDAQQAQVAKSPASSEELGAVTFADDDSGVDQQVLDLSRFSDDDDDE